MRRHNAGNAVIEFALILPFMMFITLGIIAFGRYAYFGTVVANAARAGAAYGAQKGGQGSADQQGMIAAAETDAANNGVGTVTSPAPSVTTFCMLWTYTSPLPSPNPTSNPTCAKGATGQQQLTYVSVTVTGKAKSGFSAWFLPSQVTITSTATQRVSF